MGGISVRLPAQVERALDQEAELSQRNRSELVREAVGEYLDRRRKQRQLEEMKAAARTAYAEPSLRAEDQRLQADFEEADGLDEADDVQAPESPWWQ